MISKEILNRFGIEVDDRGAEWLFLSECPYCGKAGHLYLNKETTLFKCHRCNEEGGWAKLKKQYNDSSPITEPKPKEYKFPTEEYVIQCHKKLLNQAHVKEYQYLIDRKLTPEIIHRFKIGIEKKDEMLITIPIYENDTPVNIKYRSIPPAKKSFQRWKDGKSALFNGDILKTIKEDTPIFITEGEIDCMSLCSLGYASVGVTGGAGTIQGEWIEQLKNVSKIYLVYDNDKEGNDGAKKIARRLGYERCFRVKLPVKDANEFVVSGKGKAEFEECLTSAEIFNVDNVCTTLEAYIELTKEFDRKANEIGLSPHWESVKRLTGVFEPGDLVVVSAKEKTGKTIWTLNMALKWAQKGHPVLFYCLEMRPQRLVKKSIQNILLKTEEELDAGTLYRGYRQLNEWPIYWGYNYKKVSAEVVFETIREAWKRYGIEVVIFDNLHYLARDIKFQTQEVGFISRSFKLLAEELEIPIILIAQPRKIGRDDVMGIEDLKDSSSIGADADQVIILYREKTAKNAGSIEAFKPETLVRVDASRFKSGGETLIRYDGAKAYFGEIDKIR